MVHLAIRLTMRVGFLRGRSLPGLGDKHEQRSTMASPWMAAARHHPIVSWLAGRRAEVAVHDLTGAQWPAPPFCRPSSRT